MKKTEIIILIAFLVIIAVGAVFVVLSILRNNESNNTPSDFESKISESTVSVELKPIEFKDNKLYVSINVNTHSIELRDYDLKEITTLIYNNNEYKPITAPNMEWHHSSGVLVFDLENVNEINDFKIIVKDLPDIEERIFEW